MVAQVPYLGKETRLQIRSRQDTHPLIHQHTLQLTLFLKQSLRFSALTVKNYQYIVFVSLCTPSVVYFCFSTSAPFPYTRFHSQYVSCLQDFTFVGCLQSHLRLFNLDYQLPSTLYFMCTKDLVPSQQTSWYTVIKQLTVPLLQRFQAFMKPDGSTSAQEVHPLDPIASKSRVHTFPTCFIISVLISQNLRRSPSSGVFHPYYPNQNAVCISHFRVLQAPSSLSYLVSSPSATALMNEVR